MKKKYVLFAICFGILYIIQGIILLKIVYVSPQHSWVVKYYFLFFGMSFTIYFCFFDKKIIKFFTPFFIIPVYYTATVLLNIYTCFVANEKISRWVFIFYWNEIVIICGLCLLIFPVLFYMYLMKKLFDSRHLQD